MEAFLEETQHLKIQLEEIKSATNNFDDNNIIGRGGFGKVYKGLLSHSKGQTTVAFKRLDRNYGQGNPEFLREILMLSRYTHENLISLLGFCDESGDKILVYEHAYHGSLDRHLGTTTLTWWTRLKICLAAARGLCYLHDPKGSEQRVIHRDIKSSNILLDENWNAKLSDLGLSKIGPANQQNSFLATNVVGTFGYIDPLYMETYFLTKESDVYSFGMVLFEVLCGRLCFEYNSGHFLSLWPMWKKSYEEKKLGEIIFEDLKEQMSPSSLKTFSDIAYRCLQRSREERPKMFDVVEQLEIALHIQKTEGPVEGSLQFSSFRESNSASIEEMSTRELLSVDPLELKFNFELNKQISSSLQLTNKTDNRVGFKVKTTNANKYGVRPNIGVVLPRSTCEVIVTMKAQKDAPPDMQCKDRFLFQSVIASPGATPKDITHEMFTKEAGRALKECKLRVVYLPPNPSTSAISQATEELVVSSPKAPEIVDKANFSGPEASRKHVDSNDKSSDDDVRSLVSQLTNERNAAIQQSNRIRQELDLLRRASNISQASGGGIPLIFVIIVSLIGLILGYVMKK